METTGSHGKNSRAGFWAHIVQVQYFTGSLVVKNLPATAGDAGSIPGLGSSPGGGHGNPLQCSCPENPMDRGAGGLESKGSQRVGHNWATEHTKTSGPGTVPFTPGANCFSRNEPKTEPASGTWLQDKRICRHLRILLNWFPSCGRWGNLRGSSLASTGSQAGPWALNVPAGHFGSARHLPPILKWREVKWLSRVWLFVTPWTVAHQAPLSMEFFRQEYWRGLPFASLGLLPNPGIEPGSPTLQADALLPEPPGKPPILASDFPSTAWQGPLKTSRAESCEQPKLNWKRWNSVDQAVTLALNWHYIPKGPF